MDLRKQMLIERNTTHNLRYHPLYQIWCNIKARCYNKNHHRYKRYGARGIIILEEWKNNFQDFYNWAIANGWEQGLSIERENIDKNYESSNCKWIPLSHQQKNTSRSHKITYDGKTMTISDWAAHLGIKTQTLFARINNYNWPIEKALQQHENKQAKDQDNNRM